MNNLIKKVKVLSTLGGSALTLCCVLGFSVPAQACNDGIKVTEYETLAFGKVIAGYREGHVTISPSDNKKNVSQGLADLGGSASSAKFLITGKANEEVFIKLHTRGRMGTPKVRLMNLSSYPEKSVRLDENGKAWIKVGGELYLSGGAHTGDFSGRFDIDVSYL